MSAEKITAESRTEFGKGAARRIRRADKVPAVIYGHGNDPIHITLPGPRDDDGAQARRRERAARARRSTARPTLALTKQVQIDPIKRHLEHIDFVVVRKGEKVTVEVPVHLNGDAAKETLVVVGTATIQLEAEATHIPEYVEVDIEGLEAGTQILASDLTLPEGSTLLLDPETLIVNITEAPTTEEIEAELDEAEAEAGIEREESDEEIAAAAEAEGEGDEKSDEAADQE